MSNASGVVSSIVVVLNVSLTPPIVKTVFTVVLFDALVVCLTFTVCPLLTIPDIVVYPHPFILYSHPLTLIDAVVFIPATVIAFDSTTAHNACPVTSTNVNASGTASAANVVTLKLSVHVPIVKVPFTAVEKLPLVVNFTATVSPATTLVDASPVSVPFLTIVHTVVAAVTL